MSACDNVMLSKYILKKFAMKDRNETITFMSKPLENEPGSGLHFHLSLVDKNGSNIFVGSDY